MLKLYNTLSRKKEVFKPRRSLQVGMYICGPTVYGPGHIGHARTYIAFDVIRRYLEYKGYKVKCIVNITDVHDDVIKESKRLKVLFLNLSEEYTKLFLKDMHLLRIKEANHYPRVTKHIEEIIKFITKLIKKGSAYKEKNSVYFDVSKFKDYGKLSGIKLKKTLTGTRVETDKYEREEASDFALWKASSPKEPGWSSPWGKGRPGWHIECSVMSQKYLGRQIDIHGGAKDLIFPHHENEIAQSESLISKKPFVKYWLHSGLLTIGGQKMAKSLKNYITIEKALENWSTRVLRLFIISSHYRSPQDFNEKALLQAQKGIERIDEFLDKLKKSKGRKRLAKNLALQAQKEFEKAMNDDFNTPVALASLFRLITQGNYLLDKKRLTFSDAQDILKFLREIDKIFDFIFWKESKKEKIPENILILIKKREKYRKKGDYKKADQIRKEIKKEGYWLEDTKEGLKVKKL